MQRKVNRRHFVIGASAGLGVLGLGALFSGGSSPKRHTTTKNHTADLTPQRTNKDRLTPQRTDEDRKLAALLAPYQGGAMVGDSQLKSVFIDKFGMGVVILESRDGRSFRVDVCRRDPANATVQPISQTKHCALFLRNSGSGDTPTDESMGLAVMALAIAIRNNESAQPALPLITKNEFWDRSMRS